MKSREGGGSEKQGERTETSGERKGHAMLSFLKREMNYTSTEKKMKRVLK